MGWSVADVARVLAKRSNSHRNAIELLIQDLLPIILDSQLDLGYPVGLTKQLRNILAKMDTLPPNIEYNHREYSPVAKKSPVKNLLNSTLVQSNYQL